MTVRGLGRSAFAYLLLLVLAASTRAASINQKVVDFCKKHIGKQVGDGDCFTLAYTALKAAGAKLDYNNDPNPGDAVWGTRVYTLEVKDGGLVEDAAAGKRVQPGDVMQFRDTTFTGKGGDEDYTLTATQHSAIVIAVAAGGKELTALHQNWNDKKTVQKTVFRLNDLKSGWVRIYHPLAP
jgi:hypothetical protein